MITARYLETGKQNSRKPREVGIRKWEVGSNFPLPISDFRLPISLFPLFLLLLFSSCSTTLAQPGPVDSFRLLYTLPLEAQWFTVDKLQQVYLITGQNEVVKYRPDGREQFRYNNNTRGELAYIDATDPFNLLLFYPELQGIATLDRTMNETGWLLLFSAQIINATAVALAPDNNIWVYDQAAFQLRKIGRDGAQLTTTDNLSAQLGRPPFARQAIARENMVYLYDPGQGVFIFDNFGQFHQLLDLSGFTQLQVLDGNLLLFQPGAALAYNLERFQSAALRLPDTGGQARQAYWQARRLYLLNEKGMVEVYERR